ncbi:hypothetical protein [Roseicyclus mahoneyensis]|uniref:Uncharacterized protein n=1 Tax=Roseicyclus mahoneyensis TaxID=164332 RepID=A0A316GMN9_9RHOB|nr:hypothetical protein [Roseicyclus mahoneyensis]PWK62407.1 hypothetical protein C7455_101433 [Roseicyclus mahoneyensis]
MMTGKLSRGFTIEAAKLLTERGVPAALVCRVLRRWMRHTALAPVCAFPGIGQHRSGMAGIAALKNVVAKQTAERDVQKG